MKPILCAAVLILASCRVSLIGDDNPNPWKERYADCDLQRIPNEYTKWLVRKRDGSVLFVETDHDKFGDPYKVVSEVVVFQPRQ